MKDAKDRSTKLSSAKTIRFVYLFHIKLNFEWYSRSNAFVLQACQKSKKITATEYATAKCKELGSILPVLDKEYSGLQAPHEEG